MIAELSGVPYGTVQKIFGGETTSPRYETIQALQKFFEESTGGFAVQDFVEESVAYSATRTDTKDVKGAGESRKGDKTLEDYLALPEGARVEMINGEFYDMAAPTTEHQDIAGELFVELKNHVRKNMGGCHPFIAPVDVQLDCDDKTMVQPDVMIVCDKNKITKSRIVGAPDFIAEVLSPTNIFMDTAIKLSKYEKAGVREYWVISPELEKVLVNVFERDEAPKEYTFDDDIPVAIWNGECVISFRKLLEY
jgi:Uma2 family endonuclease